MNNRIAFVSGCFDLLHSGHMEFLEQASRFGKLIVALGSDATIHGLKGRYPVCSERERKYMLRALRCVHDVVVSTGSGLLDFEPELRERMPDVFVVNTDGDHAAKRELCQRMGIQYQVLERVPGRGLPRRSTTDFRASTRIPYRIDLTGGWLDQPFVSKFHPGPVVVLGLEPSSAYVGRSGLATSTRATAERLWGQQLPHGDPIELAKLIFACENPPGTTEISGSQDALGIVLPGLNRLNYAGEYWPESIESCTEPDILRWLEGRIFLRWLGERREDFNVRTDALVSTSGAKRLADAANRCWTAIAQRDIGALGASVQESFEAQAGMFPQMITPVVQEAIRKLPDRVDGYKLAGAGGGGYLVAIADEQPSGFESIQVRFCR